MYSSQVSYKRFVPTLMTVIVLGLASHRSAEAIRPLPPNPMMLQAAPEKCAFFFHSFGFTKPDPKSSNKTEQLLADPDIQEFLAECKKFIDFSLQKGLEEASSDEERAEMELVFATMKKLIWRPMTLYVGELDFTVDKPTFQVGLMIDLGDNEAAAKDIVRQLEENAGEDAKPNVVDGVQCVEMMVDDELPVYWAVHQGMFLATVGDDSFRGLLERLQSEMPDWMTQMAERLPIEQRGMVGYVDFDQIDKFIAFVARTEDEDLQAVWTTLGVQGINTASFVFGLEGEGLIVRKLLACERMDGILKIADNDGLSADDIARIPASAAAGSAMRLDPAEVFDTMMDIARRLNPDAEEDIAEFRQQSTALLGGLDVRDDLLAAIGDKWVVYQSGGFATMMVPDMVASVNLLDAETASSALDAIVKLASQSLARNAERNGAAMMTIKPKKFAEAQGYTVRGLPVALSFCVHNDELIVGLSAAAIKNHLKYQPRIDDSMAVNPRIKPLLQKYAHPLIVSYSDVAKSIETSYPSLQMMVNMASGPLAQQGIEFDPSTIPPVQSITQYLEPSVLVVSRVSDGIEMEAREVFPRVTGPAAGVPIAVALLLPAVNAARAAARRAAAINNGRQLLLGILNYESAQGHLPSADADGLSWRVSILPYLEEQRLYDKFHLDEPWDSEHNQALIKEIPAVYVSPASKAKDGNTNYLAVGGKDPSIGTGEKGIRLGKIRDGLSRTIMLVEVDDDHAVPWTKPADFDWVEDNPAKGLGGLHPGDVFVAIFGDGHVQVISKTVAKDALSALFTKSGGEAIDMDALTP